MVVLSDGAVEKRTVDLPADTSDDLLAEAAVHLTTCTRGGTLANPGAVPELRGRPLDAVIACGVAGLGELAQAGEPDHVFVGGSSRMASAFDAVETVRSVLSILEQQLVVVELIEDILDRGLSVAIGAEHGFEPLASCALVLAPVAIEGEVAGTIGVVGPTADALPARPGRGGARRRAARRAPRDEHLDEPLRSARIRSGPGRSRRRAPVKTAKRPEEPHRGD